MADVGRLVCITGTVTRTSEVRPELMFGRFKCVECGLLSDPVEQQFKFTDPTGCLGCTNRFDWKLDVASSKFVDWQRIRLQENADEIPAGEWFELVLPSHCRAAKPRPPLLRCPLSQARCPGA